MKSSSFSRKVESQRICRYPRPLEVINDHGNGFLGYDFKEILCSHGLNPIMMTVKNPRSNAILERVNAVINNHLRFRRTLDTKQTMQDSDPWENILFHLSFAINRAVHPATQMTPRKLFFG